MATAMKGEITDPRDLGIPHRRIDAPASYLVNDTLLARAPEERAAASLEIARGPNISPSPTSPRCPTCSTSPS